VPDNIETDHVYLFQWSFTSVIHHREMLLVIIQVIQRKNPAKQPNSLQYLTVHESLPDQTARARSSFSFKK